MGGERNPAAYRQITEQLATENGEDLSEAMLIWFSKRDRVGWLARSLSLGERSATSLKTGSARRMW
jgi:hypothetical protein